MELRGVHYSWAPVGEFICVSIESSITRSRADKNPFSSSFVRGTSGHLLLRVCPACPTVQPWNCRGRLCSLNRVSLSFPSLPQRCSSPAIVSTRLCCIVISATFSTTFYVLHVVFCSCSIVTRCLSIPQLVRRSTLASHTNLRAITHKLN